MKTKIIILMLCSILLSLTASAQKSGGQIRRHTPQTRGSNQTGGASKNKKQQVVQEIVNDMVLCERGQYNIKDQYVNTIVTNIIDKDFLITSNHITQLHWRLVMGYNPSSTKNDNLPVDRISWNDCQKFCQKLNSMCKGLKFRLPTVYEWEYAAYNNRLKRTSYSIYDWATSKHCFYDDGYGKYCVAKGLEWWDDRGVTRMLGYRDKGFGFRLVLEK